MHHMLIYYSEGRKSDIDVVLIKLDGRQLHFYLSAVSFRLWVNPQIMGFIANYLHSGIFLPSANGRKIFPSEQPLNR